MHLIDSQGYFEVNHSLMLQTLARRRPFVFGVALSPSVSPSVTFTLTVHQRLLMGFRSGGVIQSAGGRGGGRLSSVSRICIAAAEEMHHRRWSLHSQQHHLNAPTAQGAQLRHDGCVSALLTRIKCLWCAL